MMNAIDVHRDVAQTKAKQMVGGLLPPPAIPRLCVTIESGLHAKTRVEVSQPRLTIGSASDCDITLLDDEIAGRHATVDFSQSLFGNALQISTRQKGVLLDGKPVSVERPSAFDTVPATLSLGKVNLQFDSSDTSKRGLFMRIGDRMIQVCVMALLCVGILAGIDYAAQAGAPDPMTEATQQSMAMAADADAEAAPTLEELLTDKIAEAELSDYLTVAGAADGTIAVTGRLPRAALAQWNRIHRWYDAQPQTKLMTANVTTAPTIADFPPIAAVRLGDAPEVRFLDGSSANVGEVIKDGWVLSDITPEGLLLSNGSDQINILF